MAATLMAAPTCMRGIGDTGGDASLRRRHIAQDGGEQPREGNALAGAGKQNGDGQDRPDDPDRHQQTDHNVEGDLDGHADRQQPRPQA